MPKYRRLHHSNGHGPGQLGLVSRLQLRHAGVSSSAVCHRVQKSMMWRIAPGVYSLRGALEQLDDPARVLALTLYGGPGCVASHDSAAVAAGIWTRRAARGRHASAPRTGVRRPIELGVVHRVLSLQPGERRLVGVQPVTEVHRTIADLAMLHPAGLVTSVMRQAAVLGRLKTERMQRYVDARRGTVGGRTLREAWEEYRLGGEGTKSWSEDELHRLILEYRLGTPLVNRRDATGVGDTCCDFVFVDVRLIVEVDGPHHDLPEVRAADEQRDRLLQAHGWRVIRIHWRLVWEQPRRVLKILGRALRGASVSYRSGWR